MDFADVMCPMFYDRRWSGSGDGVECFNGMRLDEFVQSSSRLQLCWKMMVCCKCQNQKRLRKRKAHGPSGGTKSQIRSYS